MKAVVDNDDNGTESQRRMWFINEEMVSEEMTVRLALSRPRSTVGKSWIRTVSKNKTGLNEAQTGTVCGTLQIFVVFFLGLQRGLWWLYDGGINQLCWNGLESHRRYWCCSETGTVSGPQAMASPLFLSENHILSHINPVFYFVTKFRLNFVLPPFFFPQFCPILQHGTREMMLFVEKIFSIYFCVFIRTVKWMWVKFVL